MKTIKIKNRLIGEGQPAYIIAEMSANHAGSIERAKEIIRMAKECGADCVKIQTYTADTITIDCDNKYFHIDNGTWEGENLYGLYSKAYTPWEWQKELKEEADRVGIDFFSTPFDKTAVDFLEEIGMEFYKIASFELTDIPLIRYVAQKGKPMILSTGMAAYEEIEEAVDTIRATGNEQIALLRCASAYPAISDEMNLATMLDMSKAFDVPTGLSDHSMGGLAAAAAVAMGGCIIEKHICLSRDIENPDSSFSMEPEEFAAMVRDIRQVEKARGSVRYGVTNQEKENIVFRQSVFAVKDIAAGEALTEENIRVIRPGYGLHPREYDHVLGKVCLEDVKRGTPLRADMVADYLTLKEAKPGQAELVFGWANEEETRKQSFTSKPISWETHEKWYRDSLRGDKRKLFIAYHGDTPVGLFRLDFSDTDEAEVSYSVAKNYRHRGYGTEIIRAGEELVKESFDTIKILAARVKPENTASRKIFKELGYAEKTQETTMAVYKKAVR
ncbi:MAG: pseudaminic acid synthase [Lachnospiraceae bacterium]